MASGPDTTRHLNKRLREEKKKLDILLRDDPNFTDIQWLDVTTQPKVQVVRVSQSKKSYTLRIYIPDDYPNSCPPLVIISPELLDKNGNKLPEKSTEFHTNQNHDGYHSICHFFPGNWNDNYCWLFQVLDKGHRWIEAYEHYMATGNSINSLQRNYSQTSEQPVAVPLWTPRQQRRLTCERELLESCYRDGVEWNDDERIIDVKIKTNNDTVYILRAYLDADYPNHFPTLAIVSPTNLKSKDGDPIPMESREFHTLKKRNGYLILCHFSPSDWSTNKNITQVFKKGELWLKTYEQHIRENKVFSSCLQEQILME